MATRKSGDAQQALRKKGFQQEPPSHHTYYVLHLNGQPTEIRTYFSHKNSGADLGMNEISGMKAQMKLRSPAELFQFIDCNMSEAAYIALLRDRGHLPPEEPDDAPR